MKDHSEKLPLSYSGELIVRPKATQERITAMPYSQKYKDGNYTAHDFYKPITRF